MAPTISNPKPDPASTSTSALLQSLEQRMSALSIKIATDRADAREKIPLAPGSWGRDTHYTSSLDRFQIDMEKTWIRLGGASIKEKEAYVETMEHGYEKMIEKWRVEGKI